VRASQIHDRRPRDEQNGREWDHESGFRGVDGVGDQTHQRRQECAAPLRITRLYALPIHLIPALAPERLRSSVAVFTRWTVDGQPAIGI